MHVDDDITDNAGLLDRGPVIPMALTTMVIIGAALRLNVASQDLFADELATYWIVSTRGLTDVVETVATTAEISPPLGFILSWLTTRLGLSPELVRLPALIAGTATIPLVYAVGTRTIGRTAALLATALTTLSPFMIFYSAEARGYGVLMAFTLGSTLALLHATDDNHQRWWIAYGALVCLTAYTHYTAIFVLAAQFAWAFLYHPRTRRPLLLATTAAAIAYLPWLPSVKGDLDSPTTRILDALSPFDADAVVQGLTHWSIGFPAWSKGSPLPFPIAGRDLQDLPGLLALVLLVISIALGVYGVLTRRTHATPRHDHHHNHAALLVVLALATPVGTALQSIVGTNVFRTRSLASSWPYLALAVAALLTTGPTIVRVTAPILATIAFALATAQMFTAEFQRPDYTALAHFVDSQHPGAVIVDGAALTPGPLTNFEVRGSTPDATVLRLNVPKQMETPFTIEPLPDPAEVATRALAVADGESVVVIANSPPTAVVRDFIDELPPQYVRTETRQMNGVIQLQAFVYELGPRD